MNLWFNNNNIVYCYASANIIFNCLYVLLLNVCVIWMNVSSNIVYCSASASASASVSFGWMSYAVMFTIYLDVLNRLKF